MRHFVHYIKRKLVDAGKNIDSGVLLYAEHQPEDQGFETPAYHSVPLNSGVASRVDTGDTIWLFSQLSSPWGKLPPSLDGMKPDFISYRMIDGTKSAFERAILLLEKNRAVFWDRWSLPRRLAERNESVGPEALDARIDAMIRSSRSVWGVSSEKYGAKGSYSKLEKDLSENVGNFMPYPHAGGGLG